MILASSERRRRRNLFGRPANGWNRSCGAAAWNRALNSPKKTRFPTNVFSPNLLFLKIRGKLFSYFFLPNPGWVPVRFGHQGGKFISPASISFPHLQPMTISVTDRRWGGDSAPSRASMWRKKSNSIIFTFSCFLYGRVYVVGASYLEVNYWREICGRWIFSPTRDMSEEEEEEGAASENDLEIMAPHISLRPTTSYFPEKWGKLLILQKWFKLAVSDESSTPIYIYIYLKKFDILFQSVFYSMSVDLEHFKLLKEVPEIKKEIKNRTPSFPDKIDLSFSHAFLCGESKESKEGNS